MDKSIHGTILSSSTLEAIDPNSLPTSITDLQQLMVAVGIVVIVWTGVFGAAKDTVAGTVTEMISSKAMDFGKWTAKLPTYLQAIPTGGKFGRKSMSLLDIGATISDVQQKTRGRSLFESAKPDETTLGDWRTAGRNSAREFAKEFAKNPHVLNTPEGWEIFKNTMIDRKKVKDETEFNSVFGRSHHDYKNAADKLLTLPQLSDFRTGLDETPEGQKLKKMEQMIAAIEARPAEPITSELSAEKAIKERSSREILNEKPFADPNIWTENLIEKIKLLPPALQEAFIGWDGKTNKAQLTVSPKRVLALADIVSAATADAIRIAVTAAKAIVPNSEITQIINSKPPELKTAGEAALNGTPVGAKP